MTTRRTGLWRHPDFVRLWGGQAVSSLGSQVTTLALPLTAIGVLGATPAQMGLLVAAGMVPSLLFGLPAGVWVDRLPRRPLLIGADLGRALMLCGVPISAWLGLLRLGELYLAAFLTGTLTLLFDVAYLSFLPVLIGREDLLEGNSKLEASRSLAGVIGPGLAGGLVQVLGAPAAILADALSFLASALFLLRVRAVEPAPPPAAERRALRVEIGEGLRLVLAEPLLRVLALSSATFNLFDALLFAVYLLYLTHTLGIAAAAVGLVFAIGAAGGLLGAVLAAPLARRFGLGPTLLGSALLAGIAELCIALARGPVGLALAQVAVAEGSVQCAALIFGINSTSLRQAIVPDRVQGRANGTVRLIRLGAAPLGALLGGLLGERLGLRWTVAAAGMGTLLAFLWILFSPVRGLREQPLQAREAP